MTEPRALAGRFRLEGEVATLAPLSGGHINASYRVDMRGGGEQSYLLQRLNGHVFPRPDLVMENIARVTRHIAARGGSTLTLVPTTDGRDWLTDDERCVWRVFRWIPDSVVRERAVSPADCYPCARAFGEFLQQLASYDGPPLHDTIPGFHDTRHRLGQLEAAVRADRCGRLVGAQAEVDAVLAERAMAEVLPPRFASGALPTRIVHNDAKIANVLFDRTSGAARCVVDLDTVMPGSALSDFGDLVRSSASPTAEDEQDCSRIGVQLPLYEALARGYLDGAGDTLSKAERDLLAFAGGLVTLEQAARFLTDHLEGDRYYKVSRPEHNLIRCRAQLALFRSLSDQVAELEALVSGRP